MNERSNEKTKWKSIRTDSKNLYHLPRRVYFRCPFSCRLSTWRFSPKPSGERMRNEFDSISLALRTFSKATTHLMSFLLLLLHSFAFFFQFTPFQIASTTFLFLLFFKFQPIVLLRCEIFDQWGASNFFFVVVCKHNNILLYYEMQQ